MKTQSTNFTFTSPNIKADSSACKRANSLPTHSAKNKRTVSIVSIRPTTYFSYRSDALVLPQKENEQKIFRRGEAEAFECLREKRLVNIGVQQKE